MKVMNREAAWAEVNKIFPTDYEKNGEASNRAGYPVYRSTADGINAWISDMGDRLEVNLPDGKSVNIWIEESEEEQKNEQPAMPHYGEMLSKQIRDTADTGKLTAFEKFVLDRGWLFSTEESLKAGYDRVWKSSHGIMITQEEFLAEANLRRKHANAAETYNALAAMVAEKKAGAKRRFGVCGVWLVSGQAGRRGGIPNGQNQVEREQLRNRNYHRRGCTGSQ